MNACFLPNKDGKKWYIYCVSCDVCVSSPNKRNVNTESSLGLSLKRTLQESYTKAGFWYGSALYLATNNRKVTPAPMNSPFASVHIRCIGLRQCEETKSLVRIQTWNCRYKTLRCVCCPYRKV